jgi:hypothetical protein
MAGVDLSDQRPEGTLRTVAGTRVIALGIVATLALSGCLGGDDDEPENGATDYAVAVEGIADDLDQGGGRALTALNRFADGTAGADQVGRLLDRASRQAANAQRDLEGLVPPPPAESSADDLEFAAGDLSRALDSAAIDVRATERGISDPAEVGRTHARIVLAYKSGFSALSRAVRALAAETD